MDRDALTELQQRVLDWVRAHIALAGWPPTRSEIAREFGFTATRADRMLHQLARKGRVALVPGSHRGIKVL